MEQQHQPQPKKIQIWLPLLLSLMLVAGMLIGVQLKPAAPHTKIIIENDLASNYLGQGRVEELIRYIEAKYVDQIDSDKMVEKAINGLIKELDPHSSYMTAEEVVEINEQLQGNFKGIGVEFMILEDTIVVIRPLDDGPSQKAGIIAGDRIVAINDTIVAGDTVAIKDIVKMLRGKEGSKVNIGVHRRGETALLNFDVKRGIIPMTSVDISMMLTEETGYIKVNRFSASTYNEFMRGVEKLAENHGMKHLVIDLRQNPGGYLQEATKILSQLFPSKDRLLVYTEGRAVHRNDYESTGQNFYDVDKIAVLIDEGSASASEIIAGAIQDWDRGVIIGRRSFGKGLVQEQYQLKDGSALRLTVARYYTPSGRSIQRPYDDQEAYDLDINDRLKSGELWDAEKIALNDTTIYETSKGRTVYGGGGISPDIFVALDTLQQNDYIKALKAYIPNFAYRYIENHKKDFTDSLDNFIANYLPSDEILEELVAYAEKKDLKRDDNALQQAKTHLQFLLKARMAKQLYDDKGLYQVLNSDDKMIDEALKAISNPNPLVIKR